MSFVGGVPVVDEVAVDCWVRHPHSAEHVLLHDPPAEAGVAVVEDVVAARNHVSTVVAVFGPAQLGVKMVGAQRLVEPRVELASRQRALRPKRQPPVRIRRVLELLSELQ